MQIKLIYGRTQNMNREISEIYRKSQILSASITDLKFLDLFGFGVKPVHGRTRNTNPETSPKKANFKLTYYKPEILDLFRFGVKPVHGRTRNTNPET